MCSKISITKVTSLFCILETSTFFYKTYAFILINKYYGSLHQLKLKSLSLLSWFVHFLLWLQRFSLYVTVHVPMFHSYIEFIKDCDTSFFLALSPKKSWLINFLHRKNSGQVNSNFIVFCLLLRFKDIQSRFLFLRSRRKCGD